MRFIGIFLREIVSGMKVYAATATVPRHGGVLRRVSAGFGF
jgi:hypothetical protein